MTTAERRGGAWPAAHPAPAHGESEGGGLGGLGSCGLICVLEILGNMGSHCFVLYVGIALAFPDNFSEAHTCLNHPPSTTLSARGAGPCAARLEPPFLWLPLPFLGCLGQTSSGD